MPLKFHDKQKSLSRRFLLVLGVAIFLAVVTLGLLIMFDQLNIQLSPTMRYTCGALFIVYGVLRVVRIFKRSTDDDDEA